MKQIISPAVSTGTTFSLLPLLFETFTCTMAMMAFVALAGPIARTLSLAPWHVGLAMTVGGLAWITTARWWGRLSDQRGRRTVMLSGLTGFAISYLLLCLFIDTALNTLLPAWVALAGLVLEIGRAHV